ncbi:hypothetical protein UA08_04479 [Talaromyces atroroseus]|uniref:Uncharacterized protein n=1 Tax=Talaromyces atroroseus TaxID=1441469 RepID=A0A225AW69_TALAT|nr:hypothetical protein UA08_04479 [Talaromyces atroroseus]OKL59859.1 hypothetical protein UA08_04479 [Talaromyces atroroseus]
METTHRSTSVLIPNRFDSKQKNHNSASSSSSYRTDVPPEIPPSPTLTNPDMILPDDGERQSSTPSPPFQFSSSDSHMLQAPGGDAYYHSNGSSYRPPPPRWTYDGHGRPLSDIGEEDFQPSPSSGGRYTSDRYPGKSDSDSIGSGSTISVGSQQRRRQQQQQQQEEENVRTAEPGDHETDLDSKRNSLVSQRSIERARAQAGDALASGPLQSSEEESSSAILSSEAERILENAKRRLTLMEGNLTRARSSMRLTQTPSPSPNSSGHLLPTRNLQPAGELYRSISQTDRRSSLLRPRPVYYTAQEGGHSRGHSETNISSADNSNPPTIHPSRSMSALASSSSSRYEAAERSFPYNAAENNGYTQPMSGQNPPSMQDFLREDELRRTKYYNSDINGSAGLGISSSKTMPKMASMDDFNSAYPPDDPPSRAQSQLQVRDLKDQAAGLRTKVALLKVKTQEDSLRRRSLQSLRTPSPFTAADRWYSSTLEHGNFDATYGWVPEAGITQEGSNGQSLSSGTSEVTVDVPAESQIRENTAEALHQIDDQFTYETDENSMLESHYEDAEEGGYDEEQERDIDRNALNRILNEPYDDDDDDHDDGSDIFEDFPPGNPPEATPHEEREDAFDYENFYLHSALGTYSRSKMRRRSYDSTGSNETTRPLQDQRAGRHSRSGSGDSVSTFATFATATENAYDGDQDDALHAIDRIVDGWDEENEEDASTPVQSRRATVISRVDEPRYLAAAIRDESPLTPTRSQFGPAARGFMKGRDVSTPSTPIDAFMSSLSRPSSSRPPSSLKADDTRLLEQVFESLGKVCTELQELTLAAPSSDIDIGDGSSSGSGSGNTPTADPKYIRTLRRRLDAARRVLDGQLDSDA